MPSVTSCAERLSVAGSRPLSAWFTLCSSRFESIATTSSIAKLTCGRAVRCACGCLASAAAAAFNARCSLSRSIVWPLRFIPNLGAPGLPAIGWASAPMT